MKLSKISILTIIFLIVAISIAGCTSTSPATSVTTAAPTGGPVTTTSGTAAQSAGNDITGANIFGSSAPYNWIEYKMVATGMTSYMKFEKSGKCTMRIEGKDIPGGSMTIDCTSKGQTGAQTVQSNPAEVKSDATFTVVGIEPVSVGAGTYPAATKYVLTSQGHNLYYWTAPGVPTFIKFVSPSTNGDVVMELNGWG